MEPRRQQRSARAQPSTVDDMLNALSAATRSNGRVLEQLIATRNELRKRWRRVSQLPRTDRLREEFERDKRQYEHELRGLEERMQETMAMQDKLSQILDKIGVPRR